jgi:hypothetical protein
MNANSNNLRPKALFSKTPSQKPQKKSPFFSKTIFFSIFSMFKSRRGVDYA